MSASSQYQQTLAQPSSLTGTSLHTGEKVTLTLKPAPVGHGIKFRRIDLDDQPFIEASDQLAKILFLQFQERARVAALEDRNDTTE